MPTMAIDFVCSRCRWRSGWIGDSAEIRRCPRCGKVPFGMAKDLQTIQELMELMEIKASQMTPQQLRQSRVNAGLSEGQAAKLIGITKDDLRHIESGFIGFVPPSTFERIDCVYGVGGTWRTKAVRKKGKW